MLCAVLATACGEVGASRSDAGAADVPKASPSTTAELIRPPASITRQPTTTATTVGVALPAGDDATVGSITDGDTFRTADGTRIRIVGVDTPERGDCYFAEASAHLGELIPPGTNVRLAYDVERLDRYGRTLAYVYRSSDGLFVNLGMARDGYALQLTIPPNVAHAEEFRAAVAEARDAELGLWSGCAEASPAAPPPTAPPTTAPPPPPAAAPTASCHASYEGTCIPPDVSDADCAGGSGNGPHYVQEKNIRVVGQDVFDLDGDADGIGCES